MASIIRTLSLKITANAAKFKKELADTKGPLGKFKFLVSKLGPVITGALAIAAVKAVATFALSIDKATKKVKQLTGATGIELHKMTGGIQALAKTYDKEFGDVLVSVNSFAKQMEISNGEAMDLVIQGFANGADASGEFLTMLKQYPVFFKEAGLSAQAAINAMTHSVKSGVFSDKGPDAIKEATLSIREMGTATKDALAKININGDELKRKIDSGAISMADAIRLISSEMGKLPKTSATVGQLLADVFKGAGEDAGYGFITSLAVGLTDAKPVLDAAALAQKGLIESSTRLQTAWSVMFSGTATAWNKFVTGAQNALSVTLEFMKGISNSSDFELFKGAETSLPKQIARLKSLEEQIGKLKKGTDEYNKVLKEFRSIDSRTIKIEGGKQVLNTDGLKTVNNDLNAALGGYGADALKEQTKNYDNLIFKIKQAEAALSTTDKDGNIQEVNSVTNKSKGDASGDFIEKQLKLLDEYNRQLEIVKENIDYINGVGVPNKEESSTAKSVDPIKFEEFKADVDNDITAGWAAIDFDEIAEEVNVGGEKMAKAIKDAREKTAEALAGFASIDLESALSTLTGVADEIKSLEANIGELDGESLAIATEKLAELKLLYEEYYAMRGEELDKLAEKKVAEQEALSIESELLVSIADNFANIASQSLIAGKTMADSFKEAAKSMLKQMAMVMVKALILAAIISAIPGLGTALEAAGAVSKGASSGGFGNIFGGLLKGKFASGTSFANGGISLVGEVGPELLNIPRGSSVLNTNKTQNLLKGGGVAPQVNVTVMIDDEAINSANERAIISNSYA